MKNKFLLFIIIFIITSCVKKDWSQTDEENFLYDCMQVNVTELICDCIFSCIEPEFETYKIALQFLGEKMNFREDESMNLRMEQCVEKCKRDLK